MKTAAPRVRLVRLGPVRGRREDGLRIARSATERDQRLNPVEPRRLVRYLLHSEKWHGYALAPCSKHVDGGSPIVSRAPKRKNVNIIPETIRRRVVPHTFFTFSCLSALRNVFRSPIDFDSRSTADVLRTIEREKGGKKISVNSCVCLFLTVADPLDHATGLEKREMLAEIAGNEVSCDVSRSTNTLM